jgi:predicted dehydrogenase
MIPPSERILMGAIGIGSRGLHVLRWMLPEKDVRFVAVCDARREARQAAKQVVDDHYGNRDCRAYRDIREFLAERTDVDAVLIATGDRWHALAAIWAMQAGKDVYVEKPSCMTIAEGRAVVETAQRYGRVYQTGTQRLSEANFVFCQEAARQGLLGRVHTVHVHIAPWDKALMRHDWLPGQPEPPREEVDWDAWLGPCPWRPYNPSYVAGAWRGFYDFHTGSIGEWGAHTIAQALMGLDRAHTCPVRYHHVANDTGDGMVAEFADGTRLILSRGEQLWRGSCGVRFEGTEGWASCADGYSRPEVSSPRILNEYRRVIDQYMARTGRPMSHVRDFFDCVKSRRPPVANALVMHYSMATVHACNICMWLGRDLVYDPVREEFPNDPEANRLRSRAMRAPYTI